MTPEEKAKEIVKGCANKSEAHLETQVNQWACYDCIAATLRPSEAVKKLVEEVELFKAEVALIDFSGDTVLTTRIDAALAAVRKEMGL